MTVRAPAPRLLLALLAALALVAAACGDDTDDAADATSDTTVAADDEAGEEGDDTGAAVDDAEPAPTGGELVVGIEAEPPGWNPARDACPAACANVVGALYDTLLRIDADGVVRPYLAESFEPNADASEWTVTLRDGVTFHDGTPLTAESVVGVFDLYREEGSLRSGATGNIVDVRADDDLTVTFVLDGPNGAFPASLAGASGIVFEPTAAAADPSAFSESPVGTGPFRFDGWDRQSEIRLVRNDAYWRTDDDGTALPYLDAVTFRFIPDEDARVAALQAGDIHVLQTLRESSVARLADDGFELATHSGNTSTGGMFNVAVPPLDDLRVRTALIALLDQPALIDVLGGAGVSEPATQLHSPDSPFFSDEAAAVYQEMQATDAEALLQEYLDDPARSDGKAAGEPIDITFSCLPDPSLVELAQAVQAMWSATGQVEVELEQSEQAAHIDKVVGGPPDFAGSYEAACWRWGAEADPDLGLYNNWISVDGNPSNFVNLTDETLQRLLTEGRAETDPAERQRIYQDFSAHLASLAPIFYAGHTLSALATGPDVTGLVEWTFPDGTPGEGQSGGVTLYVQTRLDG